MSVAVDRADVTAVRWIVYVLISGASRRTYVGVTNDLAARLAAHNGERPGGAKATRAARPWTVAKTYGPFATRALAQQAEWVVKQRRGRQRLHADVTAMGDS